MDISGSCGCDDNYFSLVNDSPLLNGNQEQTFNPSISMSNLDFVFIIL